MSNYNEGKKNSKKNFLETKFGRFTIIIVLVVLLWNTFQVWAVSEIVSRVDKYNVGSVDELGKILGDVKLFAEDLNEIRRFLMLPERKYSLTGGQNDENESPEHASENTTALYAFLDSMKKERNAEKSRVVAKPILEAFLGNENANSRLASVSLSFGERSDLQLKFIDKEPKHVDGTPNANFDSPLFGLVFSAEEDMFKVQSVLGDQNFPNYTSANFSEEVLSYLVNNAAAARAKKAQDSSDAQKAVDDAARKEAETLENRKTEFVNMIKDSAFVDTLAELELKVSSESREEINKLIYDVFDKDGNVKFSLVLEVSSGMIKVLREDKEIDLKSFLANENGSKKKPL